MTTEEWAEREIEIVCKKENPNWDGKSFDYGCACYQSALKAYKSLCEDDHKGWWHSGIASRLVDEMFPITMPYYPSKEKYKVYGETFYMINAVDKTAEHIGTYNLVKIYYIITPNNERIEVNKEFKTE